MGAFGDDDDPGKGDVDKRRGWIDQPGRWSMVARVARAPRRVSPARQVATIAVVAGVIMVLAWAATHPKAPVVGVLAIVATVAYLAWTRLSARADGATQACRAGIDRRLGGDRAGLPGAARGHMVSPDESPDVDQAMRDSTRRAALAKLSPDERAVLGLAVDD